MSLGCETFVLVDNPVVLTDDGPVYLVGEADSWLFTEAPNVVNIEDTVEGTIVIAVPGPPGVGWQEVFVQQAQPAEGPTEWLWAQLDGGGDVEFLKVYQP